MTRPTVTHLRAMLDEARREKATRERVYPKWIREGKIKEDEAHKRIDLMDDISQHLQRAIDFEECTERILEGWPEGV